MRSVLVFVKRLRDEMHEEKVRKGILYGEARLLSLVCPAFRPSQASQPQGSANWGVGYLGRIHLQPRLYL